MPKHPGILATAEEALPAEIVATTVGNSAGNFETSTTLSHDNPSTGAKLLAFILPNKGSTGAIAGLSVTYNDVVMTDLGGTGIDGSSSRNEAHLFELDSPATGVNDLVVSASDSIRTVIVVYSVSNPGAMGTVATNTYAAVDASDDEIELSVGSSEGDLVIWGVGWRGSAASITFGAGQTGVDDQGVGGQNSRGGASWKDAGTGTSTVMDATLSGTDDFQRVAMVGVAIG